MRVGTAFVHTATVLAIAGLACKTNKVEIPDFTGPSVGVATVPLINRSPAPTPTPPPAASPDPAATPTPAAQPTPSPSSRASCSLPPGSGDGDGCQRTGPSFLTSLESAIDQLVRDEPELFDLNDAKCPNCYHVRDSEEYIDRIQELMQQRGICTTFDGEELGLKNTNDFNDQYDILTADFYIRRGDGAYRSTCRPAWF